MSKPEQPKEAQVHIRLPQCGFLKLMYFNRLQVEHEKGFCLVNFGLVSKSGLLQDSYGCVLAQRALDQNRTSVLEYLGRIGAPSQSLPPWQSGKAGVNTEVADIIGMAYHEDTAETCLYAFSMSAASRLKRPPSGDSLEAQPLALLRSTVEMQKQLIKALYAD